MDDPLDLAQNALIGVAHIASRLGAQQKRPICGRLGAELFLVADYLDTAGLEHEHDLRHRVSKLLSDVESICNWPHRPARNVYPRLEALACHPTGSPDPQLLLAIEHGIKNLTSNPVLADKTIRHIKKFTRDWNKQPRGVAEDIVSKASVPVDYPSDINRMVHEVLRKHVYCTCRCRSTDTQRGNHLVRLLLRPPDRLYPDVREVQYDMLFSSAPCSREPLLKRWQDVDLIIPRARKGRRKSARFSDDPSGPAYAPREGPRIDRGQLCKLISLEADVRLRLEIQDGELHQSGFEPLKQKVQHAPGISLADLLGTYHFTSKMKIALAYILAHSVWLYYDSDWMKLPWTSKTIEFIKESSGNSSDGQAQLFAWKPYIAVLFGDKNCNEFSNLNGEIHHFPRVKALGVMMVEIGIGSPLPDGDCGVNCDYLLALQYSKDQKHWRDFDYPDYLHAVDNCLDPATFNSAPFYRGQNGEEQAESLKERRNILYHKVVSPLEELLRGTKWMEQLTAIPPLQALSTHPAGYSRTHSTISDEHTIKHPAALQGPRGSLTRSQKNARAWLTKMQILNHKLSRNTLSSIHRPTRIAVLDTGCHCDAPFFLSPENQPHLKDWKDWVDHTDDFQDSHGHGTQMISVIMKIAPRAHIYVARVAKSPRDLTTATENVTQAISWACSEWKVDIISMSFGYAKDQPNIRRAIRNATADRDDSILFFAAASNYGANEKEMFPARLESVISMRATNGTGEFAEFNPPCGLTEGKVLGTLGVDVSCVGLSKDGEEVYQSGTSVATAVAVGIAALLLEYVEGKDRDLQIKMRTRSGMLAVLRALSRPTVNDKYLYLAPWALMDHSDQTRLAILVVALADL